MIDANLPAETIRAACATAAQSAVPVFLEPVSIPKAARCAGALRHASYISPNAAELRSIADELARAAGRPPLPRRAALRRRAERQREARQHIEELAPFAAAVLSTGRRGQALCYCTRQ